MEILIILLLILLNGIFSMSEMAVISARKFKMESKAKQGDAGAQTALDLAEKPSRFLSTVQIGITLIGILLGMYSGDNITHDFEAFLAGYSSLQPYAHNLAVGLVVVMVTFLSILLGELLPKRLGILYSEGIAAMVSRPMRVLSLVASPFVWLLSAVNDLLLRVLGLHKDKEDAVTEEEIKSIIKESTMGGEIQEIEQDIVDRVFELGDRRVDTLFTHRSDIVFISAEDDWETVRGKVMTENHSAYPVCRGRNFDDLLGVVLLKDLFGYDGKAPFSIADFVRPPVYFNEHAYAYKVLERFRKERVHYGIVVDEYGGTLGMITMDDVLDALLGDVSELGQEEYQLVQRGENSWLVDGAYSIREFARYFEFEIEEDAKDEFHTVAGLILYLHHSIPNVGEKFTYGNLTLEVVDRDGQRIDKVMVERVG